MNAPVAPVSPVPILLVDDEERNLTALEAVLEGPGYDLVKARSGDEALRALRDQDFAAILLDVQMPAMNGFEVARLIKLRKKTRHIPVLFLTAHYQAEQDALSGYDLGAVDYLTKPFNPGILRSKVAVFAELYRKTRALEGEIAERRQAEARVRELNTELARRVMELAAANNDLDAANNHLESFSYMVSHDLRAPLRQVSGFSTLLERSLAGRLDDGTAEVLRHLQRATGRMTQLIDDLLAFSRVGRTPLETRPLDLGQLVDQARDILQPAVAERTVDWRIGELPRVQGDAGLLQQVIVNLLDNALKFTRERNPAVITVGALAREEGDVIFVRDNGAGFDGRYADKIFGVFQRLHTESEFEGTGIGLALSQRIIARHGGRIWAESAENQGATISFLLPRGPRVAAAAGCADSPAPVAVG